jgi:hypothetical protein
MLAANSPVPENRSKRHLARMPAFAGNTGLESDKSFKKFFTMSSGVIISEMECRRFFSYPPILNGDMHLLFCFSSGMNI